MTEIWTQAVLWLGLALIATSVSIWLRVAMALSEIVVGTIAQLVIGADIGHCGKTFLSAGVQVRYRGECCSTATVR